MEPKGLHQLYLDQLRSLYNAETQQIPLLAELVQTTTDEECRVIFGKHLEQTNNHVDRLEQIFAQLGEKPEGQQCVLMKALVQEVHEIVLRNYGPYASMAALIGAFQHIEHHEIAGYGTVRSFARQLNEDEAANTLQHTLNEEAQADRWL
ncbi:MAG TPA: DUF892 family protein, partial [Phycisphaerae bacterium]|nr:DUF892 family protein [Phycisphaerae bacterium]